MNLYLEHFRLKEPPFQITPTVEFFFRGGVRGEILDALAYALQNNAGILAVTGEVGTGKTMMCRTLMESLDSDGIDIVYIANPSLSGREILYNISEELDLELDQDKPNMVRQLQNFLIEEYAKGKKVIVFIDEAQAMPDESLEELRLLSNLETGRDKLLQIVMFGQPELTEKITQKRMRQLRERITSHFDLKPFGEAELGKYIESRLRSAGYSGERQVFSRDACRLIWQVSEGILRRVNIISDKSLLAAFARGDRSVTAMHVQLAARDAGYKRLTNSIVRRNRSPWRALAASVLAAGLIGAAVTGGTFDVRPGKTTANTATVIENIDPEADAPPPGGDAEPGSAGSAGEDRSEVFKLLAGTSNLFEDVSGRIGEKPILRPLEKPGVIEPLQSAGAQAAPPPQSAGGVAASGVPNFDSVIAAARSAAQGDAEAIVLEGGGEALVDNPRWRWMPDNSYLRRRLNATEYLLTSRPRDFHTIRLMTVAQDRAMHVENFLRDLSTLYPIRNVMVYPMYVDGRSKFVVTYGLFESHWAADSFVGNMPRYVKGSRPHAQALVRSQFESARAW